jgi:tripartite motif-containing protein 71
MMEKQIAQQAGPGGEPVSRRRIGKVALGAAAGLTLPAALPAWIEAKRKKRKKKPRPPAPEPTSCNETACLVRAWGGLGHGEGQFDRPWGMAVSPANGDLYVADYNNSRVQRFSASGEFIGTWGSEGTGNTQFQRVIDVAVAPNGDVLALDYGHAIVKRFTADGAYLSQWGGPAPEPGPIEYPVQALAVDGDGDVYVLEGSPGDRVFKFTASGELIHQFGGTGSGDGELFLASGLAAAANGDVLVADTGNRRVQRFSASGAYIEQWSVPSLGSTEPDFPQGLTEAADGTIFVTYGTSQFVRHFSAHGELLGEWSALIGFEGRPMAIIDVAVHQDQIYVTDQYNELVQQFTLDLPPEPKRKKKRKKRKKH